MDIKEILCEKIIALFQRNKGRDLYDMWFLLSAGVELDKKLLKKKLLKSGIVLKHKKLSKKDREIISSHIELLKSKAKQEK